MLHPDVTLSIICDEFDASRLDAMARALARSLRNEGIDAVPAAAPDATPGAKGDPVTLGTIVLALIGSGGVAVTLLQVLRAYLERKSTLRFEVTRADGRKVSLDASWFGKAQLAQTQTILARLLEE
ncbi:MAG TPA: hypothetical protein VMB34_27715 [Acetobacteraceae bacterium]|nr:hypothetical protein [Acetobacteraceae bacterium]